MKNYETISNNNYGYRAVTFQGLRENVIQEFFDKSWLSSEPLLRYTNSFRFLMLVN